MEHNGQKKSSTYPEVVNARFPEGTKDRIAHMVAVEKDALMRGESGYMVSESVIVRRAVLKFLAEEGY